MISGIFAFITLKKILCSRERRKTTNCTVSCNMYPGNSLYVLYHGAVVVDLLKKVRALVMSLYIFGFGVLEQILFHK